MKLQSFLLKTDDAFSARNRKLLSKTNKISETLELTPAQTKEIQSIIDTLLNKENIEKLEEKIEEQRTSLTMTAEENKALMKIYSE